MNMIRISLGDAVVFDFAIHKRCDSWLFNAATRLPGLYVKASELDSNQVFVYYGACRSSCYPNHYIINFFGKWRG